MLPLTESDRALLMRLAHQAVEDAARDHRLPDADLGETSPVLQEKCGAFVSLHQGKHLRGCIGYVEALKPLWQTVRECAVAAALRDPRFSPVTPREVTGLSIEISVLSPLFDIAPEEIEIGKHGLVVSQNFQRGLLLPQVAVEWNWDRKQFLEETCLKAGLEADAWKHGARVQAFTAVVFGETSSRANPGSCAA